MYKCRTHLMFYIFGILAAKNVTIVESATGDNSTNVTTGLIDIKATTTEEPKPSCEIDLPLPLPLNPSIPILPIVEPGILDENIIDEFDFPSLDNDDGAILL
ncbi:uncharacterized protein LOC132708145 [Cylas formicarius]|uniref:uncharacterized protein LOC132708145 n=1 Tax=Cylas formicarius TaxID=197179 RepID=UPI002958B601|nr:uncharacterized protein LOC132708145 [Cylas formicarius]